MLALDEPEMHAETKALVESHVPAQLDPSQGQKVAERDEEEEAPEKRRGHQEEERQTPGVKGRELPEVGAVRNRDPQTSLSPKGRSRVRPTGWKGPLGSRWMNKKCTLSPKHSGKSKLQPT